MKKLLNKYDVPAPRYTSYPTVPYWKDSPTTGEWIQSLNNAFSKEESSWSLYLHIPFCETLCTFCGCNTSITKNHEREKPYMEMLHKEWSLYKEKVPEIVNRKLKQIHIGGGTPTFFSPENLKKLVEVYLKECTIDKENFEGSFEVDPRRTTTAHLESLYSVGFKRVSLGVQDFNHEVQRLINRVQPYSITKDLTQKARDIGYESVNFDLIYGLPKQSLDFMIQTVEQTLTLKPDRIALYSFAKVPWIKPAQRLFKDEDLPVGAEKRELYDKSRELLMAEGYEEIGMDHFALKTDSLYLSQTQKKLHRNFMGYTDDRTDVLLGLGVSSISESPDCFHQNEKVLKVYERELSENSIPTFRGHKLSDMDIKRREQILKFMTGFEVELESKEQLEDVQNFIKPLIEDKLVEFDGLTMKMKEQARPFLRIACMALDQRLRESKPNTKVFSQAM